MKTRVEGSIFYGENSGRIDEGIRKQPGFHDYNRSNGNNETDVRDVLQKGMESELDTQLNRQFRKVTKNKPSFVNDDSLRKLLYLASKKIVERRTRRCRNWDVVLNQLDILFADRIAG